MGNDCSQRVCPFELSFVDTPRGDLNHNGNTDGGAAGWTSVQWSNTKEFESFPLGAGGNFMAAPGEAHFYAECSGKGECDRSSGECKCYSGYTGSACQRTTCPKDCSGHGVCRTLKEIAKGKLNKRVSQSFAGHNRFTGVRESFDYNLWDADKSQACVCDPGFSGVDCSQRQCPRGDDPLTTAAQWCGNSACAWEVQSFTLSNAGPTTYKLGYVDYLNNTNYAYVTVDVASNPNGLGYIAPASRSTALAGAATVAGQIQAALRAVPGGQLQRVEVYAKGSNPSSDDGRTFQVTFVGVPGDVEKLTVDTYSGAGTKWANPDDSANYNAAVSTATADSARVVEVSRGNFEAVECSGRGLCDSGNGLCKCFNGFYGAACEYLNALAA
jgi:hypothetical protein